MMSQRSDGDSGPVLQNADSEHVPAPAHAPTFTTQGMNHMKTTIATAIALIGLAGTAHAQLRNPFAGDAGPVYDYNSSIYVMPQIGGFNPDNRFGTEDKSGALGLKFGKAINRSFDIQVGGSYARVRDDNLRYQQTLLGLDGLWMLSRDRFRPFLSLGIGAENDRRNIPNHQNSRSSPYASAGAGVQYIISDQWVHNSTSSACSAFSAATYTASSATRTII